jgi:hypothetical protein
MTNHTLTQSDLSQFTGTENHYRNFTGLLYTDGARYLAEHGGAYWLIDAIGSHQRDRRIRGNPRLQDLQLWRLTVHQDRSATLTCHEDSDQPARIIQQIEYTDFPLDGITLFVECGVLLLPSEH